MEAKSAKQVFNELRQYYAGHSMALIHGKIKNAEKQEIMEAFTDVYKRQEKGRSRYLYRKQWYGRGYYAQRFKS